MGMASKRNRRGGGGIALIISESIGKPASMEHQKEEYSDRGEMSERKDRSLFDLGTEAAATEVITAIEKKDPRQLARSMSSLVSMYLHKMEDDDDEEEVETDEFEG